MINMSHEHTNVTLPFRCSKGQRLITHEAGRLQGPFSWTHTNFFEGILVSPAPKVWSHKLSLPAQAEAIEDFGEAPFHGWSWDTPLGYSER